MRGLTLATRLARILVCGILLLVGSAIFPAQSHAAPITDQLEIVTVNNVDHQWTNLPLVNSYTTPVAMCTYTSPGLAAQPAQVRMRTSGGQLQVSLEVPVNQNTATAGDVICLVSEEGSYTTPLKYEARLVTSTQTNSRWNWNSTRMVDVSSAPYRTQTYTNIVVLGSVMTYDNTNVFASFWTSSCNSAANPPSNTSICVGKHSAQTDNTSPNSTETLGVFFFESGTFELETASVRAGLSADTFRGLDNPFSNIDLGKTYTEGVTSLAAMDGTDGGWAVFLSTHPLGNTLTVAIDEDQIFDAERWHTMEQVSFFVVAHKPVLTLTKNVVTHYDPVNLTVNPKAIPGSYVNYDMLAKNNGYGSPDNDLTITDALPSNTELCVATTGQCTTPSLGATNTSGLTLSQVNYSNDNGSSFNYSPVPDGDGVDPSVTHIQFQLAGQFLGKATVAGSSTPEVEMKFRVRLN